MSEAPSLKVKIDKLHTGSGRGNFPSHLTEDELNRFLELTVEHSSEEVFWIQSDSTIFYVNEAACTKLEYSRQELIGMRIWDWDHQFPKEVWPEFWATLKKSKHVQFETKNQTKYGKLFPVQIQGHFVLLGDKEFLIAYARDLTERKEHQDRLVNYQREVASLQNYKSDLTIDQQEQDYLKKVAERLSKLEIAANIGTWEVDLNKQTVSWSEQTKRIHEVESDYEPQLDTAIEFYKEGFNRDTISSVFQNTVATGAPYDLELMIVTATGRERLVRAIGNAEMVDGKCVRVFGVFQDVTAKYQLQSELAETQKSLQDIMDHAPAVVYIKDIDGRYKFINQKYLAIFGFTREQVIGKTDLQLLPEETAKAVMDNDRQVASLKRHIELEEQIPQLDGVKTYISEKFPLFNSVGEVYAICGISTDITERRQQEEQLRRSQKMDALGKLTGGIAHDFNNLLGIILGYSQVIEVTSEGVDASIQKSAERITYACERGANLTKKLLAFSGSHSHELIASNLNDVITKDREMLQKIVTVSINIDLDLAPDLWWCKLDISDFEDAMINLTLNAQYAMDNKGTLTISTENVSSADSVLHAELDYGEYVCLILADTGCGMDQETKERLFDPFFTTKGSSGTGLGLSQVYGFMKRCGGFVEVESSLNQGTKIQLYFPRANAPVIHKEQNNTGNAGNLKGRGSILVVDDEKELVNIATLILSSNGYSVTGCNSAKEALEHLSEQSFDLVISDVVMPEMDGYELASAIKNNYPNTKFQLVSGYSDTRGNTEEYSELKDNLLSKPFRSESLLRRVSELLDT